MANYPVTLQLADDLVVKATCDGENNWRLDPDERLDPAVRSDIETGIAVTIAASWLANQPDYVPVWDQRWADQAAVAYPGSVVHSPYPSVEGRVY